VPVEDLSFIVKAKKPDFLYSHLTSLAHNFNIDKFLQNLHARVNEVPVLISGPVTLSYKKPIPKNFLFKKSLHEVKDYIAN
ncbi:MAG TPA: MerR family transcriptional regulator, partial [Segetibacter sp.]